VALISWQEFEVQRGDVDANPEKHQQHRHPKAPFMMDWPFSRMFRLVAMFVLLAVSFFGMVGHAVNLVGKRTQLEKSYGFRWLFTLTAGHFSCKSSSP
jgi:hypothetical protein